MLFIPVCLSPQEDECTSSSWEDSKMYTFDTITNSQGMSTEINKNFKSIYFSEKIDTLIHLKTFRIFSKEIPFILLIPSCWYFSCRQMYSERCFDNFFHELKMFFKISVPREIQVSFLEKYSLLTAQFSLTNLQALSFNILI